MSEYTDDEEKFVRSSFVDFNTEDSGDGSWLPMTESEAVEHFDRWLAEHDARLIEGLADEVGRMYFGSGITGAAYTWGCKQVADRLRERARQVREGEA